jgi:hypothetical protein
MWLIVSGGNLSALKGCLAEEAQPVGFALAWRHVSELSEQTNKQTNKRREKIYPRVFFCAKMASVA